MFAHEIIYDLENTVITIDKNIHTEHKKQALEYLNAIQFVSARLKNQAIKFHIGDLNKIEKGDIFMPKRGNIMFNSDNNDYNMPYKNVYLDYKFANRDNDGNIIQGGSGKHAIFVIDDIYDDGKIRFPMLQVFFLGKQMDAICVKKVWKLFPEIYYIIKGKEIDNCIKVVNIFPFEKIIQRPHFGFVVLERFLKLLNTKNITTKENYPNKALNKARTKKGKLPLFSYKTLVIKPATRKQQQQQSQGLWDNRVHLCRGHFKTYTEENPLFGRITGRYWWQPCVRGKKEKGIIMKDYEVRTDAA